MVRLSSSSPRSSPYGSGSGSGSGSSKRPIGLFTSISSIIASFTKQASRLSKKVITTTKPKPGAPTKLLSTICNKAIMFLHKKEVGKEPEKGSKEEDGIWQRSIMMGDKCQPLDYLDVIYYDSCGNQISDLPLRSPRASLLPSYAYNKAGK